uniref:glutathione S-transferase omega-1-like n=1 Tax=Styela clava TaxID=7725 RepID=UPI00193A45E6|nr:glutathione S-transferase omega-1-like [Styela clava]
MQYCPYSMRVQMILAKKNVDYEIINIDLLNKPTWFMEKYPFDSFPVLEQDDILLAGSLVIAEYIDENYSKPGERTIPQDSYEKGRINMMIVDKFTKAISAIYQGLRKKENWEENFNIHVGELEKILETNKFFNGEELGYADYMGHQGIDDVMSTGKFTKLEQWLKTAAQEETIRKCDTKPEILGKFLTGYTTGTFDFDFNI